MVTAGPLGPGPSRLGHVSGGADQRRDLGERAELGIDGLSALAMVGSGGSSTVYRARQDALDREVAVKVVHAAWTMETRERFEHERELMGRLSGHTAIVPIFETGITKRGEPYLLMPYYHRGSLFRLMRDRGPLPWPEAGFLLETVALTLADCHREGIVHRDVKPGNVMLTRHLHPRLADFGIALPLDMATSPATVAYTPSYSPPEAFEPGVAAPTIDVYGLGATLWALLAGRAPSGDDGDHGEDGDRRSDPEADGDRGRAGPIGAPRPDLPGGLADLLERSLDPDPGGRPPDAAAFVTELRRATRLSGPAGSAGSSGSAWSSVPSWSPGRPDPLDRLPTTPSAGSAGSGGDGWSLAGLAALVVVGLALVAFGLWSVLA